MHAVEDQRQVVDDYRDAGAVHSLGEDEGTRPLTGVDAGGLLVGPPVAQHAALGGLSGDVGHATPDQVVGDHQTGPLERWRTGRASWVGMLLGGTG